MQAVPGSYFEAQIQQPFREEASQPMELVVEVDERLLQLEMKRSCHCLTSFHYQMLPRMILTTTMELLLERESSQGHRMPVAMREALEVSVASTSVAELIATLHSSFQRFGPPHLTHGSVRRLLGCLRSPSFSHRSDHQASRTTDEVAHQNSVLFPVAEQLELLRRLERLCIDQTTRRQGDQSCFHECYHSTSEADQGILCPNFVDAGWEDEVLTQ